MALMKCPECGHDVSSKAPSCPNCGYPLEQAAMEFEKKLLLEKIKPVEFTVPEGCRASVCSKCCQRVARTGEPLCKCGFPLIEVDYPSEQHHYPDDYLYIYQHDIIPRNIGDPDCDEFKKVIGALEDRIKWVEQENKRAGKEDWKVKPYPPAEEYMNIPVYVPTEEEERQYAAALERLRISREEKPVPKCPICGSTSLTKLTAGKKLAKVSLLGIFGAGDIGKAWKCNSCGCRF